MEKIRTNAEAVEALEKLTDNLLLRGSPFLRTDQDSYEGIAAQATRLAESYGFGEEAIEVVAPYIMVLRDYITDFLKRRDRFLKKAEFKVQRYWRGNAYRNLLSRIPYINDLICECIFSELEDRIFLAIGRRIYDALENQKLLALEGLKEVYQ